MSLLHPPVVAPQQVVATLREQGFATLDAAGLAAVTGCGVASLLGMARFWDDLPADAHLKDGGRYRRRRHGCWVLDGDQVVAVPHRAHWQPLEYNALHGGMQRWFEPVAPALASDPAWLQLLRGMGHVADALRGEQRWFLEAHQFRIDTTDGIGRPTPEGAHRDGVDVVAVILMGRQHVKGGETRVFAADGPHGQRFTLTEPGQTLLLDDARMVHESTPIQPLGQPGWRDTLVLTLRGKAFQEA